MPTQRVALGWYGPAPLGLKTASSQGLLPFRNIAFLQYRLLSILDAFSAESN